MTDLTAYCQVLLPVTFFFLLADALCSWSEHKLRALLFSTVVFSWSFTIQATQNGSTMIIVRGQAISAIAVGHWQYLLFPLLTLHFYLLSFKTLRLFYSCSLFFSPPLLLSMIWLCLFSTNQTPVFLNTIKKERKTIISLTYLTFFLLVCLALHAPLFFFFFASLFFFTLLYIIARLEWMRRDSMTAWSMLLIFFFLFVCFFSLFTSVDL